ncbi:DUF4214 domain-containing protein [Hominifimenecus sp. rT4P-3]|uniref:DUF4214 domain-containing protein n=1 Tax=Hominifimenecus sp. rT4P-3 TaxID=3242979 RepID=UPI003DA3C710
MKQGKCVLLAGALALAAGSVAFSGQVKAESRFPCMPVFEESRFPRALVLAKSESLHASVFAAENMDFGQQEGTDAFVTRLYRICLGREPDSGGRHFWKERLKSEAATGADVAGGFFRSEEYLLLGKSEDQYVEDLYQALLGRASDTEGKRFWLRRLAVGSSRNLVFSGFVNSEEFTGLCGEYGVVRGSYTSPEPRDRKEQATSFVQRLYQLVLQRDGEADGLNNWTAFLLEGGSGAEVVEGFLFSEEFRQREMGLADYTELLYQAILGRSSDEAGKNGWLNAVRAGRRTPAELIDCFTGSLEFRNLCEQYQIEVGSGSGVEKELPRIQIWEPEVVNQMQKLVNEARAEAGLPPLTTSEKLENLALRRAAQITENYSHEGHVGGENIAHSSNRQADPKQIFQGWMDSPGHRANMMAEGYRSVACARYQTERGSYWVMVFEP